MLRSRRGFPEFHPGSQFDSTRTYSLPATRTPKFAFPERAERSLSPGRRQRRRMNDMFGEAGFSASAPVTTVSTPVMTGFKSSIASSLSSRASSPNPIRQTSSYVTRPSSRSSVLGKVEIPNEHTSDEYNSSEEDDLAIAAGQLSLNEDEQVRYHGKASGLHLLGAKERIDDRNEGGIWLAFHQYLLFLLYFIPNCLRRFPKARVWPPVSSKTVTVHEEEDDLSAELPSTEIQEQLLKVYFEHVHSFLPVVHKDMFYERFRIQSTRTTKDSPAAGSTPESDPASVSFHKHSSRRVPALLLFAMFAIAVRYSDDPSNVPRPSSSQIMWTAGDIYLERAQAILGRSYTRPLPTTCQALLLMGYREMGIGAMASAWTHIGMAIRMAQDLGMHRGADGWARAGLGGRIFEANELQERRRIWYACVVMDRHISAYIGGFHSCWGSSH